MFILYIPNFKLKLEKILFIFRANLEIKKFNKTYQNGVCKQQYD